MNAPEDWIVPDWPAPPQVKALITTRSGGVSRGPYASFNLGLHTGDDQEAVSTNRALLAGLLPQEPRWLAQQHGTAVADADGIVSAPPADASIARLPGTVCAIMVADCVPVLFTDRAGTLVAAAHAGWRGLAGGVLERTVQRMAVPATQILTYLGPGIGPRAFEVGSDVYRAFVDRDPDAAGAFVTASREKWRADLYALARRALRRVGVTAIFGGDFCTVSDSRRFYSYRRDRITGRMAALVWRVP
ncbi:MAG: peptidoglycan editing factor PgeF [Betaproteobacteria bacterium]